MKKVFAFLLIAVIIATDQIIKIWIRESLELYEIIVVIPRVFNITHIENPSGALGLFPGKATLLAAVSGILLLIIAVALFTGKFKSSFMFWTVSVGFAGGVGNLIDRVARSYVIDYLDFSGLFFPWVFNFADCCVVVSTLLILIYIIKTDMKTAKNNRKKSGEQA